MKKQNGPPYLGAAYYPEAWPVRQVGRDIALMKKAGMNVMRVGEFAWSTMEPREGRYDFDWLRRVVDKLAGAGMAAILCTPSCTPPAWLSEQYPEILLVDENGQPQQHGARRHACPNSPVYRAHCARIVTRLAEEFGKNPDVIGWQIDNELYPWRRGCCCPVCVQKFRDRLRRKFGTVGAMNKAWGLALWSQAYQAFDQVPVPRSGTWHHPSLLTEWMCFQSDSYVEFTGAQAAILHRLAKQPVGTDMMPFGGLNYRDIHRGLDLVQFNHYNTGDNLWECAFWMDFIRPLKPAPFWNTETSTCWNGGIKANGYREPGFCRANSWLPCALGGEANLYWLWRAHWSGQELMHGSVVSSCGRPLHIWDEVREVSAGFRASAGFLNGTRPVGNGLALHFSGLAWWMFEFQPMVNGFKYDRKMLDAYRPLLQAHLRPDVIDPAADLSPYRVVFSPFLPALDEAGLRRRLLAWIRAGGTWIAGPLTDNRTLDACKHVRAPFGSLEAWAGTRCRHEIPGDPVPFNIRWKDGRKGEGSTWFDGLEPKGAEVLAEYVDGPNRGLAAVVSRRLGRGRVIQLATMPGPEDLGRFLAEVCADAGVRPVATASPNLLVVPRRGKGGRGMVIVEIENKPASIVLEGTTRDLLSGRNLSSGRHEVPPYGVLALKAQPGRGGRRDGRRGT